MGNLPAEVTSFVGRRREVAEIKQLLSGARLVTLTGFGGVGKSRLASRAAREVKRSFSHGTWLVELASVEEPDLLCEKVAATLGVVSQSRRPPIHILSNYLERRELLLVLDNCEHLADACATLAGKILGAAEGLRILVTSRHRLHADGEHILPVSPFATPEPNELSTSGGINRHGAAMTLFAQRACAVDPTFAITTGNQVTVARICQRLEGIPLAIELATPWLRTLSLGQILARLDDRFRLVTRGSRTAPPRQRTLRATLDWSYRLCSPEERKLWAGLSVFADGFDLSAVENVCCEEETAQQDVLATLAGLVDKSIVVRTAHGSAARYRQLETVRQYGRHRLRETGGEALLRRRHRDHYLRLCERAAAEWFGSVQADWLNRLRRDHANLQIALGSCLDLPDRSATGLRMATALWFYWRAAGLLPQGRRWLDLALEHHSHAPSDELARALCINGWIAAAQSDFAACEQAAKECRAIARCTGSTSAHTYATHILGLAALHGDDPTSAAALLDEALTHYRSTDRVDSFVTLTYLQLASMHLHLGNTERGLELCQELRATCEAHGERWLRSYALYLTSRAHWDRDDLPRAVTSVQECLRSARPLGDLSCIVLAIDQLACLEVAMGVAERAAVLLAVADRTWLAIDGQFPRGKGDAPARREQCRTRIDEQLDNGVLEAALRHGAALSLDEGIAYALNEEPDPARTGHSAVTPPAPVTRRELEVATLIAQGLSNKDIATRLVISRRTAEGHVEHLRAKLGFTTRTQIAVWITERLRGEPLK
ncbi:ATP-binding protein [Lentzea tibetensis]|nr:LuxR C-terminal-related transcriptional regulator [Lentzea tibetensis]